MLNAGGVILAGEYGWDDSGFGLLPPRAIAPVVHVPLICHTLYWLRRAGITHVTICANSSSRRIRQSLGDGGALGVDLDYYEDWTPRGPAGCIRDAAENMAAEPIIVSDGTILPDCDLRRITEQHMCSDAAMTVVAAPDSDAGGQTRQRLVPTGIYVIDRCVLEQIPRAGYQDVKEVLLPRLYAMGVHVSAHALSNSCPRVTDTASYIDLNAWALKLLVSRAQTPPGYRRLGASLVHESARVDSGNTLVGSTLIGPRTTVDSEATVVGPSVIGADCVIEARAVVCHSVLWSRCRIEQEAAVSRCVVGEGVKVEAGTSHYQVARAATPNTNDKRSHLQPPDLSMVGLLSEFADNHQQAADGDRLLLRMPPVAATASSADLVSA